MSNNTITPAEALIINQLINYTEQGIASRVLAKNGGGISPYLLLIKAKRSLNTAPLLTPL